MAILHVRNVSDALYNQIKKLSKAESRSFSSEAVHLLEFAVHEKQAGYDQKKLLAAIGKRLVRKKIKPGAPDSLTFLREDRNR
jgi:predicted hydrocarbon binding protein